MKLSVIMKLYILPVLLLFLLSCKNQPKTQTQVNEELKIDVTRQDVQDFEIETDTNKLEYLGYHNIDELNLLGAEKPTSISKVGSFASHIGGKFHNYLYNQHFLIQTRKYVSMSSIKLNPELLYTTRMLEVLRIRYPELYQNVFLKSVNPNPIDHSSGVKNWTNSYKKIIISFNHGSEDVAISGTYLDPNPTQYSINGVSKKRYDNLAIISINPVNIKGENKNNGSYPIYKKPNALENYLLFMKEGLLHSVVHEMFHRYVDIRNNETYSVFNYLSFGNGRLDTSNPYYSSQWYNMEEVVVNRTMTKYFERKGGLSPTILSFYSGVENSVKNNMTNYDEYRKTLLKTSGINKDLCLEF